MTSGLKKLAKLAAPLATAKTNPWRISGGRLRERRYSPRLGEHLDRDDLKENFDTTGSPETDLDAVLDVAAANLELAVEELKDNSHVNWPTHRETAFAGRAPGLVLVTSLRSPVAESQAPPRVSVANHNYSSVFLMEVA